MYPQDFEQRHPAVPPLYPMDPCRPKPYEPMPMPYEHMPMDPYAPMMPYMHCPMMDPRFRDCVRVCMMQCGSYPMQPAYPMDMHYETMNMDEPIAYYPGEIE
ncbi:hypothetical protein CULT_1290010 [[Clostridium] ultunense Esp]|uniref:Uncharacterized protein n=1 Tax=[Clostridium] ultunense Esp TaxID=1288971 RepID=M1Z6P5_9FIRM|nr:hypothetical protein [Schnuerera ultunensis]CCQ93248.1 hypothetical protein CULT_1290010 [[Clostridium] ultunense Esp]SHD76159.1 conserved protein of unknown function [[Clostridium] ultunense Esp]